MSTPSERVRHRTQKSLVRLGWALLGVYLVVTCTTFVLYLLHGRGQDLVLCLLSAACFVFTFYKLNTLEWRWCSIHTDTRLELIDGPESPSAFPFWQCPKCQAEFMKALDALDEERGHEA